MRVEKVAFIDWYIDRLQRRPAKAVIPPEMSYWRPNPEHQVSPPAQEPGKGLNFDAFA